MLIYQRIEDTLFCFWLYFLFPLHIEVFGNGDEKVIYFRLATMVGCVGGGTRLTRFVADIL